MPHPDSAKKAKKIISDLLDIDIAYNYSDRENQEALTIVVKALDKAYEQGMEYAARIAETEFETVTLAGMGQVLIPAHGTQIAEAIRKAVKEKNEADNF